MVTPLVRQGPHVGEDVAQAGNGDRQAGLGGGLADDGVVRVLAVVDGAAGQGPDAGRAGSGRGTDEEDAAWGSVATAYAAILRSGSSAGVTGGILPGLC